MRQLMRLVRYVLPFLVQLVPGIVLLAGVGFLEAFRLLLLKPVFDRVLNPGSGSDHIVLFVIPKIDKPIYLQSFVPSHFHNAWTIVAFALVASTVLKGIFARNTSSKSPFRPANTRMAICDLRVKVVLR